MWKHKRLFVWIEREIFWLVLDSSAPLWYNTGTVHIGHMNAYRYRGYYYDRETGLYYLNTRYYDPETGRFINRDSVAYADASFLNGLNLYAYCNNNPVMYVDPNGNYFLTCVLVGLAIGAVVAFGVTSYADYKDDGEVFNGSVTAGEYIGNTVIGGGIGALAGAAVGAMPAISSAVGAAASASGVGFATAGGGAAVAAVSVEQVLVGAGAIALISNVLFSSKKSKISGKEGSTEKPSWVNQGMLDPSKSAIENATRLLNEKWGINKWHKGANTEFNKIVKWLVRHLGYK